MDYKLKVYSIWDCGKRVDANGNPHQEDSIFPAHNQATDADRLFILCDGMGGHEAGEVASATVCEAMSSSILSAVPDVAGEFTEEILRRALADAYDALDARDDGTTERKMGTTMTLLKLYNKGCMIAHMGDSRVYHIRPGKTARETRILFRTEDHSLVNDLVRAGELTPEEAKLSNRKNVITRAMQPHMEYRPKADIYHTTDIRPNDYFYLCSDGMLEHMEDHQLCYFFSDEAGDDAHKVDSLLQATQENRDNHSAIIVHILGVRNPIKEVVSDSVKVAPAPLMGEVHEPTVGAAGNRTNGSSRPDSKKAKRVVWTTLLLVLCLAVVVIATVLDANGPKGSHAATESKGKDSQSGRSGAPASEPIKRSPSVSIKRSDATEGGSSMLPSEEDVFPTTQMDRTVPDTVSVLAPEPESNSPQEQERPTPVADPSEKLQQAGREVANKLSEKNSEKETTPEETKEEVTPEESTDE